jgi:hypothetical protein
MLVFALANVISICPVLAHQVPAAQSCCEHSHGRNLPCTDTTPNNCPYVLLEKSQAKAALSGLLLPGASIGQIESLCAAGWLSSPSFSSRQPDSSASYLRFRDLRI